MNSKHALFLNARDHETHFFPTCFPGISFGPGVGPGYDDPTSLLQCPTSSVYVPPVTVYQIQTSRLNTDCPWHRQMSLVSYEAQLGILIRKYMDADARQKDSLG